MVTDVSRIAALAFAIKKTGHFTVIRVFSFRYPLNSLHAWPPDGRIDRS
jgi:hypothetical protein